MTVEVTDHSAADVHDLLRYSRTPGGRAAEVHVQADATGVPVPPALFGNFFEHMSDATIGGACAELLVNGTMGRRSFLSRSQIDHLRANARAIERYAVDEDVVAFDAAWRGAPHAAGFGSVIFDEDPGLPLGWMRSVGEVRLAVGRTGGALRLRSASGIRQGVSLPARRPPSYAVAAVVRATSSPGRITACFRRRLPGAGNVGAVIGTSDISVTGEGWRDVELELRAPALELRPLEPVDFELSWQSPGAGDLLIDRVSLLPSDHVRGFDPEVLDLARRARIPELRWPGGNVASFYSWRDGIGPVDDRPTVECRAWGGLEQNLIGTDEYLWLCRHIGAEPHITVNAGTGSAQEAAAWVEYCNGAPSTPMGALRASRGRHEPYGVRIWEVGNELFGQWQGGNVGAELHAERFAEFALAMRAASPTAIYLEACGNWFDFVDTDSRINDEVTADGDWHARLLDAAPDDVDAISIHALPLNDAYFDGCAEREVNEAMLATIVTGERRFIPDLLALCDASRRRADLPPIELAMTEWGPIGGRADRLEVSNFGAVAWGASLLNLAMRSAARITSASPNGLLHGGAIHRAGGVAYADPQFWLLAWYRDLAGSVPLRCWLEAPGYDTEHPTDLGAAERDVPYVDVLACRHHDEVDVIVVSREQQAVVPVTLALLDGGVEGFVEASVLAPPAIGERVTPASPDRFRLEQTKLAADGGTVRFELPPLGVVWLKVPCHKDSPDAIQDAAEHAVVGEGIFP